MVIPAILEKDFSQIEKKINICKRFTNIIHIDFIDRKFANNSTFMDFDLFSKFSKEVVLEAHLMVEEPVIYLEDLRKAGFKRFIGQIEKIINLEEFVAEAQLVGGAGIGLDIDTPLEEVEQYLEDIDTLLLMAVKVGFSGEKFNPEVLGKIAKVRQQSGINIEVDGGINQETILDAKRAGANNFTCNSFLFESKNPEEAFNKLTQIERTI